jgi:hypothetical protein
VKYKDIDPDKIAADVDEAIAAGNYRLATEEEKLQVRVAALETIVKSYQHIITETFAANKTA